jgi:uncharacterized protein YeaO (DUF488 family)
MSSIAVERIYERAASRDGIRILVDRLWPNGVGKGTATLDLWSKDVAPGPETRTWFELARTGSPSSRSATCSSSAATRPIPDLAGQAASARSRPFYDANDAASNPAVVLAG